MKYTLLLLLASLVSLNLHATTNAGSGQKWYGPYTVDKVARYWDGNHRMSVHVTETPNTTCDVTNTQQLATYYYGTSITFMQQFVSVLMAAQAQNKKVMLLLDYTCHTTYGLNLHGIEILSN
ncbi:hypothetical protein [Vibrio cionasavignyae]|uniref:hypothetical protein n=1 Tax=Vibrio cionasavignyae TaxID=2910252 RepID=UPI003D0A6A3B